MQNDPTPSESCHTRVYRDVPIPAPGGVNLIPPRYREMRKLVLRADLARQPAAVLFYHQGMFMADFEDDFPFDIDFVHYFPTYQGLNNSQLRSFFAWRTRVRRGEILRTSLSLVYLYLYELLNQIGVPSPLEGFHQLHDFWQRYREIDPAIDRHIRLSLNDYVVYYNLDRELLRDFARTASDEAVLTLLNYRERTPREVFLALDTLSPYHLPNSKFYKQYPDEVENVVSLVYADLDEFYTQNRKNNLGARLFGEYVSSSYSMFNSAVFFDRQCYDDYLYEINPVYQFHCCHGRWSCERFLCYRGKLQPAGELLRLIDALMREKYQFQPPLKIDKASKLQRGIISAAIDRHREQQRRLAAAQIRIDPARLHTIRAEALEIRDKLIVEEPEDDPPAPAAVPAAIPPEPEESAAPPPELPLDPAEFGLLCALLRGESGVDFARSRGLMPAVLADGVNEKLFDTFGDTVLAWNGDVPEIVPDYLENLIQMVTL